ncbi:MAG: ATPase, partial [Frondihabitans sp.]|nr:ATPase [Frondihabitans sp.]
ELGGTIDWHTLVGSGTEVTIDVPLRWMQTA